MLKWQQHNQALPLRWTDRDSLHVTLVPPWYEQDIGSVIEALMQLQGQVPEIKIQFSKIFFGPRPAQPRLLWAEGKATAQLYNLKEQFQEAVQQEGNRKLRPHITLGRCTKPLEPELDYQNFQDDVFWNSVVNSVVLYESVRTEDGSQYDRLLEIS